MSELSRVIYGLTPGIPLIIPSSVPLCNFTQISQDSFLDYSRVTFKFTSRNIFTDSIWNSPKNYSLISSEAPSLISSCILSLMPFRDSLREVCEIVSGIPLGISSLIVPKINLRISSYPGFLQNSFRDIFRAFFRVSFNDSSRIPSGNSLRNPLGIPTGVPSVISSGVPCLIPPFIFRALF